MALTVSVYTQSVISTHRKYYYRLPVFTETKESRTEVSAQKGQMRGERKVANKFPGETGHDLSA